MRKCHEVDYEIIGEAMQMVVIELDPSETVVAEAGGMTYMEDGVEFETKMGDGSNADQGLLGKIFQAGVRKLTGESVFMTHFSHRGQGKSHVAFSAPYPGHVMALDMQTLGGSVVCQKDAFLCAALGTKVSITFNRRLGAGFFGGDGFILQKLEGDGMAFLHACGSIVERKLNNDRLRVDTGCLVGFTSGVDYDIERAGGLKSMIFGGEGLFLATLSGTGKVWLQSLPFSRLADRILASAPASGGSAQGEGSALGGLGRLVGGDR
ncbi:MAG: TIGR00266 family protein [Gammaproteobacteria bacterium]